MVNILAAIHRGDILPVAIDIVTGAADHRRPFHDNGTPVIDSTHAFGGCGLVRPNRQGRRAGNHQRTDISQIFHARNGDPAGGIFVWRLRINDQPQAVLAAALGLRGLARFISYHRQTTFSANVTVGNRVTCGVDVAVGAGVALGGTGEAVGVGGTAVAVATTAEACGVFCATGWLELHEETKMAISARRRIVFFIGFFPLWILKEFYQQSMQKL
jgi:hypothetical protein